MKAVSYTHLDVYKRQTLNSVSGKYEKSITAPTTTSFNLSGGAYALTVEATDDHGNKTTDGSGRLVVKETVKPTVTTVSYTHLPPSD